MLDLALALRIINISLTFSFMISGNSFLIYGLLALITVDRYATIPPFDKKYTDVPAVVVTSGVIVFLSAWIQLFYLLKNASYPPVKFGALVSLLCSMELVTAICSYVQLIDVEEILTESLGEYWVNDTKYIDPMWHLIQETADCCGLHSPKDYEVLKLKIPYSCCGDDNNETCSNAEELRGCLPVIHEIVHDQFKEMGTFAFTILGLQVLVAACGVFLFRHVQNQTEYLGETADRDGAVPEDNAGNKDGSLNIISDRSEIEDVKKDNKFEKQSGKDGKQSNKNHRENQKTAGDLEKR